MYCSLHYRFSQRFRIPAIRAYEWCTDYDPQDLALMHENAELRIVRISKSTIILTDLYRLRDRSMRKQKLVYLERLSWTSTHITGRNKYSQFLYEIVPESEKESRLEFIGLHVERVREDDSDGREIDLLVARLKEEDSTAWRLLATEMEREMGDHSI